ncbi:MAG: carboxypeptidase Y-deficient [Bathelium mastoideum]|nr:MAG: carboxypeptidase Y-deficient [Bathelium mastoideum]
MTFRHLDDTHRDLEEIEQDEVKTWFKAQIIKAKKFQPLAVLNQKLKGLDVFESNDDPAPTPPLAPVGGQPRASPEPTIRQDPDEFVSRNHWQRPGPYDSCSDPTCGFERDHTNDFLAIRRKTVDKAYLEVSRLEKRLTKLTQLLTNPPPDQGQGGLLWSLTGTKAQQQRQLEQSIVVWEEDASVLRCPFCQQDFSSYSFRRHHCRLCGRVVCGDPITGCSTEIGLNVAAQKQGTAQISLDVRMCKDCKHTVFSKSDFARGLALRPADQRSYENLKQFERGIRLLLPKFQRLLLALQDPETPPTPAQLADAQKVRKRLMDSFTQYDTAARRVRDLPTTSPTQQHLQKAVYQAASNFLHLHMLPLKSLPKILKHATPNGTKPPSSASAATNASNGKPRPAGALASIHFNNNLGTDTPSSAPSTPTAASSSAELTALESEERALRERLIVLEEQRFLVGEMVADARRRRKFDEVAALTQSWEELGREVDGVQREVEGLDFEGAWRRGVGDGG